MSVVVLVFFHFLVLFFETSNPHFHVTALPVLSEHSIGNVGIAKTYVLQFQSVVCSCFFFSSHPNPFCLVALV